MKMLPIETMYSLTFNRSHPIHIHLVDFQVISRVNGKRGVLPYEAAAQQDVVVSCTLCKSLKYLIVSSGSDPTKRLKSSLDTHLGQVYTCSIVTT
jgi:hypothetical protein